MFIDFSGEHTKAFKYGSLYSKTKKGNTPIYFNTNYPTGMKLVPIIIGYCLLQFDALKFFLGVRQHGVST